VQVPTSRPPPPRRAATQVPFPNPFFANAATPLHQTRDSGYNTYAADLNASGYSIHSQPQRYTTAHSPVEQDRFAMNDIVDALYDRIAQNGEAQRTPPLGRHQAERRDGGFFDNEGAQRMPPLRRHQTERSIPVGIDDEWQRRYPSARGAVHGAYGRYWSKDRMLEYICVSEQVYFENIWIDTRRNDNFCYLYLGTIINTSIVICS
jgi:hypothetical protein